MNRQANSSYFSGLHRRINILGGMFNAHLHLDRSGTYEATLRLIESGEPSASSLSLTKKHSLIPTIHASECYDPDQLESRVDDYLGMMADVGTTRADSVVDVTTDRVGLSALERLLRIKIRRGGTIDFRVGAYTPLGFRDDEPERFELLEQAARLADFIGCLPERDDQADYPEHIGFEESCQRMLELADRLGKPLHVHVDQKNHESESGTECVLRLIRAMGLGQPADTEPRFWMVHVISPSAYDEERFATMLGELAALNVGVICCPSAAISMRQYRPEPSPTRNSIARVLEMLAAGVHVRVGSDNICDITSPAGTVDLMDELFVLSNALRYYDPDVLAKLGAGMRLDEAARERVKLHLLQDREEVAAAVAKLNRRHS